MTTNKISILTSFMVFLAAVSAMAKPAMSDSFTFKQPDGTVLTLTLVGDEFNHVVLTDDDCPVVFDNETGGYTYAKVYSDGRRFSSRVLAHDSSLRPSDEKKLAASLNDEVQATGHRAATGLNRGYGLRETAFNGFGEKKSLVILVEFQDLKFGNLNGPDYVYTNYSDSGNEVHDYWYDQLNREGFNAFGATGSCRDWFMSNSLDVNGEPQFKPQFDLYGPVTLPNTMSYYGANDYYGHDELAYMMVADACSLLDSQVDYSVYDTDGDGMVDNVFVIYAGYGEADGGSAATVWPHTWNLSLYGVDLCLDGVTIDLYACSNEITAKTGHPDGIGTFCHEFSHVMGLPDLYTTDKSNAYTPGAFSVLDYGPYNNGGMTPPNYSSFERYALGWIEPQPFGESGVYELPQLGENGKAFIVPTGKDTEYFLVENRQLTGWDAYLPGHGMLIWHVDYVAAVFDNSEVNNSPTHQHVDLIEANGKKQKNFASGHPFPGTSSVTEYSFSGWDKESCGVVLENITEIDGVISSYVRVGTSAIDNVVTDAPHDVDDAVIYNLQGVRVTNPLPGQVVIKRDSVGSKVIVM